MQAASSSSTAIAHSIHVGLLPGLFLMQDSGDGSSAVIFQGQGGSVFERWIKDGNVVFKLTFQSALMRCRTNDPRQVIMLRQWSVTMAASRTYPDPLWFPLRNHGQLQQYAGSSHPPPTPFPNTLRPTRRARSRPCWDGCSERQSAATALLHTVGRNVLIQSQKVI